MAKPLREHVLRLALLHPLLRPKLVQVLREAGGLSPTEDKLIRKANTGTLPLPGYQPVLPPVPAVPGAGQGGPQPIAIQQVVNNQQGPPGAVGVVEPVAPAPAPALPPVPAPPPVAPAPAPAFVPPVSSLLVPPRAQKGFQTELLPELEKYYRAGMSRAQAASTILSLVRQSFAKKDMLYNILIGYQSSFEGNEDYLANIERLVEAWVMTDPGV